MPASAAERTFASCSLCRNPASDQCQQVRETILHGNPAAVEGQQQQLREAEELLGPGRIRRRGRGGSRGRGGWSGSRGPSQLLHEPVPDVADLAVDRCAPEQVGLKLVARRRDLSPGLLPLPAQEMQDNSASWFRSLPTVSSFVRDAIPTQCPTCPHAGPRSACPWPGRSSALAQARPAAPAAVPRGRTRRRRGRGPPPSAWSHGTRRPAVQPGCAQLRAGRRTPQGPVVTAGWQAHCDQDCSCVLCAEYWKAQH